MFLFLENDTIEDEIEVEEIEATDNGYVPDEEGAATIVAESISDWNALMEASYKVDIMEMALTESRDYSGVERLQENAITNFFGAVKAFFKKMWAKVTELWTRFSVYIDRFFKNERDFINKYEKKLGEVNTTKLKVEGYNFTIDAVKTSTAQSKWEGVLKSRGLASDVRSMTKAKVQPILEAVKKNSDKIEEELNAASLGQGGTMDSQELREGLFKALRNKQDSQGEISVDKGLISRIIDEMKSANATKKNINEERKDVDKYFNSIIKTVDEEEKDITSVMNKSDNADERAELNAQIAYAKERIVWMRKTANLTSLIAGAKSGALKKRSAFYKKVLTKALFYKESESYAGISESTSLDSIFKNLNFM